MMMINIQMDEDDCKIFMVKEGRKKVKVEQTEQSLTKRSAADSAQHKIRLSMACLDRNESDSDLDSNESSSLNESSESDFVEETDEESIVDESFESESESEDFDSDNESESNLSSFSTFSTVIVQPKLETTENSFCLTNDSQQLSTSNNQQPSTSSNQQPSTSKEDAVNQRILAILANYRPEPQPERRPAPKPRIKEICKKCQQLKNSYHGYCHDCCKELAKNGEIEMDGWKNCGRCGKFRKAKDRGFCKWCLAKVLERERKEQERREKRKKPKKPIVLCSECDKMRPCKGKTICSQCYKDKLFKHSKRKQKKASLKTNNLQICMKCEKLKPHAGRGMCPPCYQRVFCNKKKIAKRRTAEYKESNLRVCIECKELKRHECRGLCFHCAKRLIYNPNYFKACKERNAAKKSSEVPSTSNNQIPTTNERVDVSSASENEDEQIRKKIKTELASKVEEID